MSSDEAMFATYSKDDWVTVKAPLGNSKSTIESRWYS